MITFERVAAGLVVFFGGVLVALAWIFGWPAVTQISAHWASMKFVTSLCFIACGGMILAQRREFRIYCAAFVYTSMGLVLADYLSNGQLTLISTALADSGPYTAAPGIPSWATCVCFGLFCAAEGFIRTRRAMIACGISICAISAVAIAGYVFDIPALYFFFAGHSNGMAIHTAALMQVLGLHLLNEARTTERTTA